VHLTALSVSRRIAPLLARSTRGTVLAVFTRSAYVEIEGRIAVLADARLLNGPLNVLLSFQGADDQGLLTGLAPGTAVTVRRGNLELDGRWEIDVTHSRVWEPRLTPFADAGDRRRLLHTPNAIAALLEAEAPPESLARPQARPPRATRGMTHLAHAVRTGDVEHSRPLARQATEELAGLGPGLTPSGDDVMAGAVTALALLAPARAALIGKEIVAAARGRTTRISEAYLDAAAVGEAGDAWHRLAAVLRAPQDPAASSDLAPAVRQIMSFGETSGSDMLTGFVLAMTEWLSGPPQPTT
jgi:hypothetical protein